MSEGILPQQSIAQQTKSSLLAAIETVSNNKSVETVFNPEKSFTRDRVLTLPIMSKIIIGMGGQSLPKELHNYFNKCGVIEDKTAKRSAFQQRRELIKPEHFKQIFNEFNNTCSDTKTLKGYRILACDGSDVNIMTDENAPSFMKVSQNKGYNLLHINALYDCLNTVYVDATIVDKNHCNEREECIKMVNNLPDTDKTILICDRGYCGFNTFEHLKRSGINFLIRVPNSWCKEIKEMPYEEFDTTLRIQLRTGQSKEDKELYKSGKAKFMQRYSHHKGKTDNIIWDFEDVCDIEYRVIRIKINNTGVDSDDYETLITNLNRFEFHTDDFKDLYFTRWAIETSFREIKYNIGLINFHSGKPELIEQEIWAALIMYNFCTRIAKSIIIQQKDTNKWIYKVNMSMSIYLLKDYFSYRGDTPPPIEKQISEYTEPIRKGRKDKRKFRIKTPVWFVYRVA